jgi:hypothetical protein
VLALSMLALAAAVVAAAAVAASPLLKHWRTAPCEPASWAEWHSAMMRECLTPTYVCEHMTTGALLQDPDVERAFDGAPEPRLAELVGRMRVRFGCAPEPGRAVSPAPGLGPIVPPFMVQEDAPRML